MPELAEVDYYRRQWDPGLGEKVVRVQVHPAKRVFRGTNARALSRKLAGARLENSQASGKQMVFRFSGRLWVGLHLGMTGKLSVGAPNHSPGKHDHFVLFQKDRALVFTDMRQFGQVLFHEGQQPPEWWRAIAPAVTSTAFSLEAMTQFLKRHGRLSIKGALLLQKGFPGIGNWMADEILWRAGIAPARTSASLKVDELKGLWKEVRFVARQAMIKIGKDFGDPPKGWLFHERWKRRGICPKHKTSLRKETIGGRTTAWCAKCQK
jgi:formamidopyrimidine-DNA glycosylase